MIEAFYGMIVQFGFRFEPQGWMYCHGQIMSIQSNTALYTLLGTTFGGDGQVTFALPDLRVKKADGSYYQFGEKMSNGVPYIDSYICLSGIYPSRQD